jgi:twitching motility protein PilT
MRLLDKLLARAIEKGASDIHIKTDAPPYFRIDGELRPRKSEPITEALLGEILDALLDERQKAIFADKGQVDLAYVDPDMGRFRVNVFRQRGRVSVVMRRINSVIPGFEELHLPKAADHFANLYRGLVLITGTTGSGKSTSLAAIIDYINRSRNCHIVTLEDPIEYTHSDRKSVINQREIGIDTDDFSTALKAVMRQDPDVILVGEMRDLETFQAAVSASETGHLVFSTLHTTNVMQTIDRIVDLFPSNQQDQVRSQLALNLKGIMCQRLLPRVGGKGRVPACEVLLVTPAVSKLIKENRVARLPLAIQQGRDDGMQSFNESLHALLKEKLIARETALQVSDNPAELELMLQGIALDHMRGGLLGEGGRGG